MSKKMCLSLMILSAMILTGCNDAAESVNMEDEMYYVTGYVIEKNDDNIVVGTAAGNYAFDIKDAEIESEDGIDVDDTCEVDYMDELDENKTNKALKVVEYYTNSIIGMVTNVDEESKTFAVTSDNTTYNFLLANNSEISIEDIESEQTYEVKFDKKLSSTEINSATEVNVLEIDDAPSEELELVDSSNIFYE